MADSRITKRALSAALRELVEEKPFQKISVADICERCGMNRNSFYYHFHDKYDLVNWIFDTDFISVSKNDASNTYNDKWEKIYLLFRYFYDNRSFYRKILTIKGQNSCTEHLREIMYPLFEIVICEVFGDRDVKPFYITFFSDSFICSVERWIMDKDCMPPDELVLMMKSLVENMAVTVCKEMTATAP